MKKPPANDSKEAIALREAALMWVAHDPSDYKNDPEDRAGQRANSRLLKAALAYAAVVSKKAP